MREHDRIICDVAKSILAPAGLFQKGRSRIWLEDNGYYLTVVEFQPSGYSRGSFLNVAVCFLWEHTEALNSSLHYDICDRVRVSGRQFADFTEGKEDVFREHMEQYAKAALEMVIQYRDFRNPAVADRQLANIKDSLWAFYDRAMLAFLSGKAAAGRKHMHAYIDRLRTATNGIEPPDWHNEFTEYCEQHILPRTESSEEARRMVLEMITRRRAAFSAQPCFRGMKNGTEYDDCGTRLN